jgi:lipopolysaccharide transport system permease protein
VTLHLVRREFTTRHRGSVLGPLWALGPPLLQLLVTYFVFTKIIRLGVANYPVFLLTGILGWNLFARTLSFGATALEANRDLVLRPGFPTGVLPVAAVLSGLLDYLIALPILLVATGFATGIGPEVAFLPVVILVQLLLALGIAWMLAPLQVFFRDVRHITELALMLGFWITPIFYRPGDVPKRFSLVYSLNPMGKLIDAQRRVLLEGRLPDAHSLAIVAAAAAAIVAVGFAAFMLLRQSVPDRL